MRLENWIPFGRSIVGDIYDDPKDRFPDGTNVKTSTVEPDTDILNLKEGDTIKTRNSVYTLGKPAGVNREW